MQLLSLWKIKVELVSAIILIMKLTLGLLLVG